MQIDDDFQHYLSNFSYHYATIHNPGQQLSASASYRLLYRKFVFSEIGSVFLPGMTMLFMMPILSFLDHFWTSSSILLTLAGFMVQRQPFLWFPFVTGFSIFSKHLFRLRLWRTEFFQPVGAVLKYGKFSLEKTELIISFLRNVIVKTKHDIVIVEERVSRMA